ncbi:AAA-like domain protein [Aquisphaera giovannonii]|uniref:AAA-like domain protein n=1 Tax=Aquisphaera giovannonii TaxID=406548 RepID=A0A5B9W505_9BACT|nr:ATP-binding protein [Aquisphaera giovannonii]QEH35628.1 AAA-like domain protein [Aquisphaera giovannonii]
MIKPALQFNEDDSIGHVAAVDTSRVLIDAANQSVVTRVGIGELIAIRGATEQEYLIGIVERVTRTLREGMLDAVGDSGSEIELGLQPNDLVRVILIGTFRTVDGAEKNRFKRGADSFPQIGRDCYLIEAANLQRFMGLLGADIAKEEQLQLGRFIIDPDATAIASGDRFFQRHASILGSTGSGKSWTVALILERAKKLRHPNLIVLDMHGEYQPLAGKEGYCQGFRIAGPGDLMSPDSGIIFLPYWLLNRDEMLSMILDRSDNNAPNQASRFTTHVRMLKEKTLENEGKDSVAKTFTVDSPIPYEIKDLLEALLLDDTKKGTGANNNPVKGEWEGRLTRFISRLQAKLEDRRYGFMFQPPSYAQQYGWLAKQLSQLLCSDHARKGIKIVDFSEVPSDVLPIVAGTFARLLYDLQFWQRADSRTPFTLVCDEAHLYLPVKDGADAVERQALATFERIAKEGRKYGVSLVVVSQRPSDVSRTILSQCNNFLILRLTNDADQAVVRRLMPDSMAGLTEILPMLDTGEALMLGDSVLLPTRIKLDKPAIHPSSGTRQFWKEWNTCKPNADLIAEAVETLRRQTRVNE